MKKLKHSVLFAGYKFPVRLSLIIAPLIGVFFASELRPVLSEMPFWAEPVLILVISAVSCLLPMLLFYLWFHMLDDDDRRQIAEAEAPHPRSITEEEILAVNRLKNDSVSMIVAAASVGILGIVVFAVFLHEGMSGGALLTVAACTAALVAAVILAGRHIIHFWQSIDNTATAADLPAARCFTRTSYTRGGRKRERHYAVCYLPDGKYILQIDIPQTDMITVIRYKKQFCILTPQDKKEPPAMR